MARKASSSALRARLAETTRTVILDALVVELGERGAFDFSYYELARRAGVSVRTIYRHFKTRDDLLDALSRRLNKEVAFEYPRSREGLVALIRVLFPRFDRHAALIGAQLQAGLGGRVRARARHKRASVMQEVLTERLPHLPTERVRAVSGVLGCLISASSWQRLRDELGLPGEESGEVTAWAVDTLWRALELENERARRAAR
jgi:AcrR family transcriptional regulator